MKTRDLIHKNVIFFARYFKQVALAILISVAVIVGSLVIGDSVRSSLVQRVNERLGNTETVIFADHSFMATSFAHHPLFESSAKGILLTDGFISHNNTLIPVMVWGVDDKNISNGEAHINNPLIKELGVSIDETLVLRLPAQGLIPSGSLFVTENYTTSLRLNVKGTVNAEDGGNISLKNEQSLPLNIFVNSTELAQTMKVEGKINLILTDKKIETDELNKAWDYQVSGISIQQKEEFYEITSDRIFLQEEIISEIENNNANVNQVFSYLANSIASNGNAIPYSFVTALHQYKNETIQDDEVILSDYSAKRLKAKVGDQVYISYYTSENFKTLQTDSVLLRIKNIVPLDELRADSALSANFPGLSDVERCTEWDSDLPINMDLITDEDEKYWEDYRSTPKAILPYSTMASKWGSAYGYATALRVTGDSPNLTNLKTSALGIQIIHPREAGVYAAKNGVDFAGLFMALGFFIIVSAMLLMMIPISEMLHQRKDELTLLQSMGYTIKRIRTLLWYETAPVVIPASIVGVVLGLAYTTIIMWLLGNLWKGATHTEGFSVYPNGLTIISGFIVGIVLSLFVLRRVITRRLKEKTTIIKPVNKALKRKKWMTIISVLITISLAVYNLFIASSVALFSIVGLTLMVTFALLGDYYICAKGKATTRVFWEKKAIWRTLYAHKKQALPAYFSLAFGVFIVFSVGLNRQGFSDSQNLNQTTAGYSLWCESSIPIYHNINTPSGKERLSLQGLPEETHILQCLRYSADKANCLNLNKVSSPSVLGIDLQQLLSGDMQVQKNIYNKENNDLLQQLKTADNGVIPALVDATVLQWSLGKSLGDTIYYTQENGQEMAVQLVGTLPNTIFQGYILIDQSLFSQAWETTKGSEVFLVRTPANEKAATKTMISQALYEYGVRVTTTNDRMKEFNSVTDTYLTIFMTLGGVGLLLGIMGFIIIVRKNLSIRKKEIELYSTLGFNQHKTANILYKENLTVPLYAIITGLWSALTGIGTNYINVSTGIWLTTVFFAALFVVTTLFFVKRTVRKEVDVQVIGY